MELQKTITQIQQLPEQQIESLFNQVIEKYQATDIIKLNAETIALKDKADKLTVSTDVEESEAIDFTKKVKTILKTIDDDRKIKVKPFDTMVDRINGAFKPIITTMKETEALVKMKLTAYFNYKERVRQELEHQRHLEYEKQLAEQKKMTEVFGSRPEPIAPPVPILQQTTPSRGETASASYRSVWRFEIINMEQVPRDLLMVNPDAVNAKIKAGMREIPGLKIYEEKIPVIR